jgi:hypothetical protein
VKLSGAAGGNAGAVTPEVEFTNFFNRSDRPNVERAVREVLGLRDNQPLPGPLTVSFTVSCRPGIGEIGLVTLDDVGFRLPKGVTREQLEYAVRRTLNCNPVPLYAVPSMANNHQTVVIGGRPAPAPTGDAPVQVS